jgi:hypothetical protein
MDDEWDNWDNIQQLPSGKHTKKLWKITIFNPHYNKIQEKRALQGGAPQWPLKPDI